MLLAHNILRAKLSKNAGIDFFSSLKIGLLRFPPEHGMVNPCWKMWIHVETQCNTIMNHRGSTLVSYGENWRWCIHSFLVLWHPLIIFNNISSIATALPAVCQDLMMQLLHNQQDIPDVSLMIFHGFSTLNWWTTRVVVVSKIGVPQASKF